MVVSLIPKKKRKRVLSLNVGVFKKAKQVVASAGVLILVLVVYMGLWVYGGILQANIDGLGVDAKRLSREFNQEAEKNARLFASRLAQVTGLLDAHTHTSGIFKLIEEVTHRRVQFTSFRFNKDGEVTVEGLTDGYVNFGQQIIALEANEAIHDLRVSNVSLNKKGQVVFSIIFTVDKSVYRQYGS